MIASLDNEPLSQVTFIVVSVENDDELLGYGVLRVNHHQQDYPIGYVRWTENRNMQAFIDLLYHKKLNLMREQTTPG